MFLSMVKEKLIKKKRTNEMMLLTFRAKIKSKRQRLQILQEKKKGWKQSYMGNKEKGSSRRTISVDKE
jgi:hypothetical protein